MKKIYLYVLALGLLCSSAQAYGQQPQLSNLSFHQAEDMAIAYYRQAVADYANSIEANWQARKLKSGQYEMPFTYSINGEAPERGYPLYISLHGGGGAPAQVNDEQWENQKNLYSVDNAVYFVPRSPTDEWDMWHQAYMEDFLLQIVTYAVAYLRVDPMRIYLMGYSAGGDGVYNLATRLSDRFAAAAMMAGHPGDAQIENLRNLPFAIYVGAEDSAYNRAGLAVEWLREFERLNGQDPDGFAYNINIYAGKGHWMDGLDAAAIGWLAQYQRMGLPGRVVWIQDDVLHNRKYNLEVSEPKQGFRLEQLLDYANNTIYINSEDYNQVTIWLDDYILNLDKPVVVVFNDQKVFEGVVQRTMSNVVESVDGRLDPEYIYWGKVVVNR